MRTIRSAIDLDAATDSRLCASAARGGQDLAEDERRPAVFLRTNKAIAFDELKAWTDSRGSEAEPPCPSARKIG